MLEHDLFTDEESLSRCKYNWLVGADKNEEDADEVREQLDSIFLERSSCLFQNDLTTLWLKEITGYLLNQVESSEDDFVSEYIAKVTSTIEDTPFTLDRYMTLKLADFTDDVTTVNPNELLGGPEQPQMNNEPDQEAIQRHQEQLRA